MSPATLRDRVAAFIQREETVSHEEILDKFGEEAHEIVLKLIKAGHVDEQCGHSFSGVSWEGRQFMSDADRRFYT